MKFKPANKRGAVLVELGREDQPFLSQTAGAAVTPPLLNLKRILVAVDFSGLSRKAVQYAVAFAKQFHAELSLLHVTEPFPLAPEMGPVDIESIQDAKQDLDELRVDIGNAIPCQTILRTGDPRDEIISVAKELKVDLIILGTHGRTGLTRVLLGGTAERVVRHAGCPVLVLHESEQDFVASSAFMPVKSSVQR